jgi:hypothetical protein
VLAQRLGIEGDGAIVIGDGHLSDHDVLESVRRDVVPEEGEVVLVRLEGDHLPRRAHLACGQHGVVPHVGADVPHRVTLVQTVEQEPRFLRLEGACWGNPVE